MTATPRLFGDDAKSKAAQYEAELCSMDDAKLYGKEIYRIGFGQAVEQDLLSDYKVLILTLNERDIPPALQNALTGEKQEISTDDASKLIGCINALSKQIIGDDGSVKATDPCPMRRAVAFCPKITDSKSITGAFNKKTPRQSHGFFFVPQENLFYDVCADSAHIIFLSSQGRSPYSGSPTPPTFLAKNNHAVNGGGADPKGNKLELNKKKPKNIIVGKVPRQFAATANIGTGDGGRHDDTERLDDISNELAKQLTLQFEELQGVIFGRMVQKVGDRRYWEQWAKSVAEIAARFVDRINRLIETDGEHKKAFDEFLSGLQKNINPSISTQDAVEMLSQHVITKPVFEALFEGYSFVKNNAISVSMQNMLDLLGSDRLDPKHGGVICFVSNGAWLDTNAMDGFRKCLEKDFSSIYVFNLRGNCRTSGELRQKEAGNVFGLGSRTPIAITILVKKGE